jgi:hypothetical protein
VCREVVIRRSAIKEADVSRAVKGAAKAGLSIRRIEIEHDGKITKIVLMTEIQLIPPDRLNPWDGVLDDENQKRSS